ncbi:MAG: DUF6599 family protein [Candidatus Brocadiia bacterium]
MPTFRRIAQVVTFLLFIALLLHAAWLVERLAGPDYVPISYVRLSPLGAAAAMLGDHAFIVRYIPALGLLVLAALFGRFFCGWVCPLGSTLDFTDNRLARVRQRRQRALYDRRRLKYYLMAVLLIGAPLGVAVAGWFDPLSIAVRSYTVALVPYVGWLSGRLGTLLQDLPAGRLGEWWGRGSRLVLADTGTPIYQYHGLFFLILLALVGLGVWHRRYWCRNLCPLGALLGLCSQKHLLKRSVSEACISCRKCERVCPMGCITDEGKGTLEGECILCLRCQEVCPVDAVRFFRRQPAEQGVTVDLTKRGFLATLGATAATLPFLGANVPRRRFKERLPALRPPGALPEDQFLARCVRCGECMRVCPTRALQPCGFETGIEGLWTPRLVPRMGYCVYECVLCGQACPSQAIEKLTIEEKHTRALGKAKLDRSRCIPWRGHARFPTGLKGEALQAAVQGWEDCNCGTCEEACPVPGKAIRYNRFQVRAGGAEVTIDRPYVVEDLCVGCGFCENVCPVPGQAAIRVEGPAAKATLASEEEAEPPSEEPQPPEEDGEQEPEKLEGIAAFFPAQVSGFARQEPPKVYEGPKGLFEYIDGAGEPYLTYAFERVAMADYTKGQKLLRLDVWQFASPPEAFGAYSRDCSVGATEPQPLGDAAGLGAGENWCDLFVWAGPYYVHLASLGGIAATPDDARALARDVLARIPETRAELPPLVQALPQKGRQPLSVRYFRDDLARPDELPPGLDGAKALDVGAKRPAAYARYAQDGTMLYDLVAIGYDSEAQAQAAWERVLAFHADAARAAEEDETTWLRLADGSFRAVLRRGPRVGVVVGADSLEAARQGAAELARSLAP